MKLIDIHTHGIGGFDTRTSSPEDIREIAKKHGAAGVAHIIPAVYPSSVKAMREHMGAIKKAMEMQQRRAEGLRQESEIIGIHLEGPFLNPVKCGALDAESMRAPSAVDLEELLEGFEDAVRIITVAPELDGSPELIKIISDKGIIASMGHSDASFSDAEAGYHAGARGITHIFNAMRAMHHRAPGLAGFGLMNKDIYIELIADPYHLDTKIIEFVFSAKPADRIIIVSDTVKETKTASEGHRGIRDGADRLIGGSMTIKESSKRLIQMGIDEGTVLKTISANPERYLQYV